MSSEASGPGATRDTGAVRDNPKRKFPLWLLLGLLLLALLIFLILLAVFLGGSSKKTGAIAPVPVATTQAAVPTVSAPPQGAAVTLPSASPAGTPTASADPSAPVASSGPSAPPTPVPSTTSATLKGGFVGGSTLKPVPAAGPFAAGDTLGTVLFAESSAALTANARSVIAHAATVVKADHLSTIVVSGYTDSIDTKPKNSTLSQQRADNVLAALKSDVGPGPTTYSTKDNGENDPIASNDTAGGRQRNRRATVTTD